MVCLGDGWIVLLKMKTAWTFLSVPRYYIFCKWLIMLKGCGLDSFYSEFYQILSCYEYLAHPSCLFILFDKETNKLECAHFINWLLQSCCFVIIQKINRLSWIVVLCGDGFNWTLKLKTNPMLNFFLLPKLFEIEPYFLESVEHSRHHIFLSFCKLWLVMLNNVSSELPDGKDVGFNWKPKLHQILPCWECLVHPSCTNANCSDKATKMLECAQLTNLVEEWFCHHSELLISENSWNVLRKWKDWAELYFIVSWWVKLIIWNWKLQQY